MSTAAHTPPLGYAALTPVYDAMIGLMTREWAWRSRLVEHIGAEPGELIVDVGSGTGSLAVAVTAATPDCIFLGIDPDEPAVKIARRKTARAGSSATFRVGTFGTPPEDDKQVADKIVCSLVLHQVPLDEKRRLLRAMFERLKPGGKLFVADYGLQRTLAMRLAFRATVQLFDGVRDTQPNADGVLPALIEDAGFVRLCVLDDFATATGRIEILRAEKPAGVDRDRDRA